MMLRQQQSTTAEMQPMEVAFWGAPAVPVLQWNVYTLGSSQYGTKWIFLLQKFNSPGDFSVGFLFPLPLHSRVQQTKHSPFGRRQGAKHRLP